MPAALGFLRTQIAEIEGDAALRWYGVALAFLHVVTYLYWVDQRVVAFVHARAAPICWPLVRECERVRVLSAARASVLWLELCVARGLLAKRAWIFWTSFA